MTIPSPLQIKSLSRPIQLLTTTSESQKGSHRVTDFAILHLRNSFNPIIGEIVVEDVLIPIIVEVKTYHCSDVDNSHHTSLGSRNKGLVEARNEYDVKIEVKYLFSGRRQPSVIAIAGAGPCWTRCQFFQASRRMKAGCLSTMMWTSFCLARCWT
jgi:hypothetical protein